MTTAIYKAKINAEKLYKKDIERSNRKSWFVTPKKKNEYFIEDNRIMYHSLTGIKEVGIVDEDGNYIWNDKNLQNEK